MKIRPISPLTEKEFNELHPNATRRMMTLDEVFEMFGPDALLPVENPKKRVKSVKL